MSPRFACAVLTTAVACAAYQFVATMHIRTNNALWLFLLPPIFVSHLTSLMWWRPK